MTATPNPWDVSHQREQLLRGLESRIKTVQQGAPDGHGGVYNNSMQSVRFVPEPEADYDNDELPLAIIHLDLDWQHEQGASKQVAKTDWPLDILLIGQDPRSRATTTADTDIHWIMESLYRDNTKALLGDNASSCVIAGIFLSLKGGNHEYSGTPEIGLLWIHLELSYSHNFTA